MLSTAPSVYADAEGIDKDSIKIFYSDKLDNFVVSYRVENLTNIATKTFGIWEFMQIDYGAIRYYFFLNAKSGYLQLWELSNARISRLYDGKLFPTQK
jgi:hypothetical protein